MVNKLTLGGLSACTAQAGLGLLAAALLALPFFILLPTQAGAQDTGTDSSIYCPNLVQTLQFGSRDSQTVPRGQVTELQKFLADYYDLNPDDYVTGYFGRLTRDNVRRFQCERMSICSGSEATTGYGVVGPLTRAAIAQACGAQTANPPFVNNQSCQTPWGTTIQSGTSVTAYLTPFALPGLQCIAEQRTCTNGTLSGSYVYQTCTVQTVDQCTPSTQTQTLSCPTGQTGSITQTRTSTCPGPVWGEWVTTSNTCTTTGTTPPTVSITINNQSAVTLPPGQTFTVAWSSSNATSCNLTNHLNQTNTTTPNVSASNQGAAPAAGTTWTYTLSCTNTGGMTTKTASVTGQTTAPPPPPPPNPNVGACTYKGQTYQEGQSVSGFTVTCDNGVWSKPYGNITLNQCDTPNMPESMRSDFNCGAYVEKAALGISKRHGQVPFTVTAGTVPLGGFCDLRPYKIYWGDGSDDTVSNYQYCDTWKSNMHTYASPGSYTISYTDLGGKSNSANIRVDP